MSPIELLDGDLTGVIERAIAQRASYELNARWEVDIYFDVQHRALRIGPFAIPEQQLRLQFPGMPMGIVVSLAREQRDVMMKQKGSAFMGIARTSVFAGEMVSLDVSGKALTVEDLERGAAEVCLPGILAASGRDLDRLGETVGVRRYGKPAVGPKGLVPLESDADFRQRIIKEAIRPAGVLEDEERDYIPLEFEYVISFNIVVVEMAIAPLARAITLARINMAPVEDTALEWFKKKPGIFYVRALELRQVGLL